MIRAEVEQVVRTESTALRDDAEWAAMLIEAQPTIVINRQVVNGQVQNRKLHVWLVARESGGKGYHVVMRESTLEFGLATPGFDADPHLVLVGWYGDLASTLHSR